LESRRLTPERPRTVRLLTILRRRPGLTVKTALWALRAVTEIRRALRTRRFEPGIVAAPPHAPLEAEVVVNAVARVTRSTCLTRSIMRQHWFAAHGDDRDLLIGIDRSGPVFRAHAWIEGDPPSHAAGYAEILRRAPGEPLVAPVDESAFD
jgi:hypothetical protein